MDEEFKNSLNDIRAYIKGQHQPVGVGFAKNWLPIILAVASLMMYLNKFENGITDSFEKQNDRIDFLEVDNREVKKHADYNFNLIELEFTKEDKHIKFLDLE